MVKCFERAVEIAEHVLSLITELKSTQLKPWSIHLNETDHEALMAARATDPDQAKQWELPSKLWGVALYRNPAQPFAPPRLQVVSDDR
jgi:hypothetical protein